MFIKVLCFVRSDFLEPIASSAMPPRHCMELTLHLPFRHWYHMMLSIRGLIIHPVLHTFRGCVEECKLSRPSILQVCTTANICASGLLIDLSWFSSETSCTVETNQYRVSWKCEVTNGHLKYLIILTRNRCVTFMPSRVMSHLA